MSIFLFIVFAAVLSAAATYLTEQYNIGMNVRYACMLFLSFYILSSVPSAADVLKEQRLSKENAERIARAENLNRRLEQMDKDLKEMMLRVEQTAAHVRVIHGHFLGDSLEAAAVLPATSAAQQ